MDFVVKVLLVAPLLLSISIISIFASEKFEQKVSPTMQKWWGEQKKINDDETLTQQEKALAWVKIAKEYHDDEILATALFGAIFTLSGKANEHKEAILSYYNELMAIQSDQPLVLRWKKEVAGLPESLAANEKDRLDRMNHILESDDDLEKGNRITTSWKELIDDKQLLPCIESITNQSIRGKVAFAIYEELSPSEKTGFEGKFRSIITSAGELGVRYFTAIDANDVALIDAIRKEIWAVNNLDSDSLADTFVRFSIGLAEHESFWPPLLSSADKAAYDANIIRIEESYQIIDKAIKYIARSSNVFYRKGKECSGAKLALRLQAKLPLLKNQTILYGMPLDTLNFLTQTTSSSFVGMFSNHVSVNRYKVKTDEGEIVDVFPWILKKITLTEKEKKLVEDSEYSSILK